MTFCKLWRQINLLLTGCYLVPVALHTFNIGNQGRVYVLPPIPHSGFPNIPGENSAFNAQRCRDARRKCLRALNHQFQCFESALSFVSSLMLLLSLSQKLGAALSKVEARKFSSATHFVQSAHVHVPLTVPPHSTCEMEYKSF